MKKNLKKKLRKEEKKQKFNPDSKSKYASKQQRMLNGTYHGNSPFYNNIHEFKELWPLEAYPHLRSINNNYKRAS